MLKKTNHWFGFPVLYQEIQRFPVQTIAGAETCTKVIFIPVLNEKKSIIVHVTRL